MAMFNCVYLISSVLIYTKYFVHSGQSGCHFCSQPPHTSSYYKAEVAALIVKGAVFLIAIITELLVAIQISSKVILPIANSYNKCFEIFSDHLTLEHICFCSDMGWTGSSSSMYLPDYCPTANYSNTLCSNYEPSTAYGIHSNFASAWKSA